MKVKVSVSALSVAVFLLLALTASAGWQMAMHERPTFRQTSFALTNETAKFFVDFRFQKYPPQVRRDGFSFVRPSASRLASSDKLWFKQGGIFISLRPRC